MNKLIVSVLLVVMIVCLPIFSLADDEAKVVEPQQVDKITGEIAASILSAYIWRGQELSRHSVVVQPSITASYKGFTASLWGNMDTNPYSSGIEDHASNFTETDITLSYIHTFGIVSVGCGYIYYGLHSAVPGGSDPLDSQEIFATVSVDTLLAPILTVYKEIDHYQQWYATLGVSHTFALHDKVGLKLAGSVSYLKSEDATDYPEFDGNSVAIPGKKFNNLHDGVISVSLPVDVVSSLTISPTVSYVFPLSDDAKYEMRARGLKGTANPSGRDSSYLYGGIILSYTF